MKQAYTTSVEDAAEALGIGRSLAYDLARSGRFPVPVIRVGRRLLVLRKPLERLLRLQEEAIDADPEEQLEEAIRTSPVVAAARERLRLWLDQNPALALALALDLTRLAERKQPRRQGPRASKPLEEVAPD